MGGGGRREKGEKGKGLGFEGRRTIVDGDQSLLRLWGITVPFWKGTEITFVVIKHLL